MKIYHDEHQEREDLEKSLDGFGIEYLHCSTCSYIYVQGKVVYEVEKINMMPSGSSEVFFALNEVATISELGFCNTKWFAHKLANSMKLCGIDNMLYNNEVQKKMDEKYDETFPNHENA